MNLDRFTKIHETFLPYALYYREYQHIHYGMIMKLEAIGPDRQLIVSFII